MMMQAPSTHLGVPSRRPVSCGARHAAGPQAPPRAALHARELRCALPAPQRLDAPGEQGLRLRLESAFQLVRDDKWEPAGLAVLAVQLEPPRQTGGPRSERSPDFYANVGSAIRTLRDETPSLFQRDLTCAGPCRACRERAVWPRTTLHICWYAREACTLLLWLRPECPVASPGAGGLTRGLRARRRHIPRGHHVQRPAQRVQGQAVRRVQAPLPRCVARRHEHSRLWLRPWVVPS